MIYQIPTQELHLSKKSLKECTLEELCSFLANKDLKWVTIDIETHFGINYELPYKNKKSKNKVLDLSNLNPYEHNILLFQIGNDKIQYVIDCRSVDLSIVINVLKKRKDLIIVGHNLKYDISWLFYKYNYMPNNMFDTMITEKSLTNGKFELYYDIKKKKLTDGRSKKPYSLNSVSKRILGFDYDNIQYNLFEPRASKKIRDGFPGVTTEEITIEQITYARYDVIIPSLLYLHYNKTKLPRIVAIENEYLKVLITMEVTGVYLKIPEWTTLALEKQKDVFSILEKLNSFGEINWKSSIQKLKLLNEMGIDPKDKHGKSTTGKEVLKKIDTEITKLLTELSAVAKSADSFGIKFLSNINNKTGKLHTSFNQMVINGRLSSNAPK